MGFESDGNMNDLYFSSEMHFRKGNCSAARGNFKGFSSDLRFWNTFSVKDSSLPEV